MIKQFAHSLENCGIVIPLQDWDVDQGTVEDEEVLPSHNVEVEAVSKMFIVNKFEAMEKMIENKFTSIDQRLATIEAGNYEIMRFLVYNAFEALATTH